LFCNSYDTGSIADAIERLVASNESASLRMQMIARGRERARLYSQDRCSVQWLDLLRSLKDGTPAVGEPPDHRVAEPGLMERAA
jgi:glycosyltransferase involved in cell wall biosynthesis